MPPFDLNATLEHAARRLPPGSPQLPKRRPRADRGRSRFPKEVQRFLNELLQSYDKPAMVRLQKAVGQFCAARGHRAPCRASLYNYLPSAPTQHYHPVDLPQPARDALYNLDLQAAVPGHQLAFYCFNYGDLSAASFAAGLPWLALYQASRMRGWRPRSRGLLLAAMRARGIKP